MTRNKSGISFRVDPRPLTRIKNSRFESEAQILVERRAQVCFAARLIKIVKCSHLRLVVGAGRDLDRASATQLAVTRIAVAQRRERRTHTRVVTGSRRLAMKQAR